MPLRSHPQGGGAALGGDCNGDGRVSINELVLGVNIALELRPVSACGAFDADLNGVVTVDELVAAVNVALGSSALTFLVESSPANGEGDVAITRETILRFSAPLRRSTVTAAAIHAVFGGKRLPVPLHPSPDGRTATLF